MLSRMVSIGIFLLILLLPFHAFLVTGTNAVFFNSAVAPPFFISAWKEILIALLFGGIFFCLAPHWKAVIKSFDTLDILIFIFSAWALLIGYLATDHGWSQILLGAKYDLFPLWVFVGFRKFAQHIPFSSDALQKAFFFGGSAVILFGFLQIFLPPDFLVHFGYSPEPNHFTPDKPLAYCQQVSHSGFCRLQSFASGPNQLASFLLFFLPFLGLMAWKGEEFLWGGKPAEKSSLLENIPLWKDKKRMVWMILFFIGIVVLAGAFSRSALLGAFAAGLIAFFGLPHEFRISCPILWGIILFPVVVLVGIFLVSPVFFDQFLLRVSSNQGHYERSLDGIRFIFQHPWGLGLGDAGPASSRFAENFSGFLPESWYLQIGLETGILGLLLFLSILFFAGKEFWQNGDFLGKAFFMALVGVSVMGLFLHAWESASLAYVFWGLAGIVLGRRGAPLAHPYKTTSK
ncbi:MAG: O-antigen ligase family protein [Candidatus Peregrinibacteria bacterium]